MCCGVVVAFWTVLLGEKRLHVSVCVCVYLRLCLFVGSFAEAHDVVGARVRWTNVVGVYVTDMYCAKR